MSYLDDVKSRIGLNDKEQDKQLNSIINNVAAELLSRLPVDTISIPDKLQFIVVEVSTKGTTVSVQKVCLQIHKTDVVTRLNVTTLKSIKVL